MVLQLRRPVVQAPMAGGPSTPALAAAVSAAGGLGFLAAGYKSAAAVAEQVARTRELTGRPFGINVFAAQRDRSAELAAEVAAYADLLAPYAERHGASVGTARFDDDELEAKIDLLVADPVAVVTFTFGAVPADVVQRLRRAGSVVGLTVTDAHEARRAEDLGADLLVAQGADAGGHRGTWSVSAEPSQLTAVELVAAVSAVCRIPVVAAGGVGTRADLQRLLEVGARAAAVGTLLVSADESASAEAHKDALTSAEYPHAMVSRAFSGRYARGLANELMRAGDPHAPAAYPDVHHLTAPIRAAAAKAGDASLLALWAGAGHRHAVRRPAAEVIAGLR